MPILQAILLGIIQGLTEFIPISSSAHLIIIPWLFGWEDEILNSLSFDLALHLGTLVALLIFFAQDWIRIIRAGIASVIERKIGDDADRRMAWLIIIATIPGGIAGIVLESKIEALFHSPNAPHQTSAMIAMAIIIAILGTLLFLAERWARHERGIDQITLQNAILVGIAQAFAVFPGVSRSGSTITAGLAIGLKRETAARFSFFLSAPLIAGAGIKSIYDVVKLVAQGTLGQTELLMFPVGFIVAAITGYLCIRFLMQFLQKNSADIFVYYRWALAVLIVVVALVRG